MKRINKICLKMKHFFHNFWLFNITPSHQSEDENMTIIDTHLKHAEEATNRIIATINGDTDWFLVARRKNENNPTNYRRRKGDLDAKLPI